MGFCLWLWLIFIWGLVPEYFGSLRWDPWGNTSDLFHGYYTPPVIHLFWHNCMDDLYQVIRWIPSSSLTKNFDWLDLFWRTNHSCVSLWKPFWKLYLISLKLRPFFIFILYLTKLFSSSVLRFVSFSRPPSGSLTCWIRCASRQLIHMQP